MAQKTGVSSRAPTIRKLALGIAAGALMVGSIAGSAVAVPPHRHCLLTPQGWVEVGPRVFNQPHLHETAFHEFHFNIHVSDVPTTIMGITSGACSALPTP